MPFDHRSQMMSLGSHRTRWRLLVAVLLVFMHLALLLSVARQAVRLQPPSRSALMARIYHDVASTAGPGADFFALYHAGVNARGGTSVYDSAEHPRVTPYYYSYRYLPITAHTLGRSVAGFPPAIAFVLWMVLIELTLAALALIVWRALRGTPAALPALAILLLSAPYWLELYMGQFTFVATALTAIGAVWFGDGRRRASMVAVAAAVLTKVYPLVALPAFVRSREGRAGAAAIVSGLLVLNVPLFWGDALSTDVFWGKNFVGEAVGLDAGNHGPLYLAYQVGEFTWGSWHLPAWGRIALLWRCLVLSGTAYLVVRSRAGVETATAALLMAHFVSYFQVWEHHFSGAVAAGLLLCIGLDRDHLTTGRRAVLLLTAAMALPTPFWLLGWDVRQWTPLNQVMMSLSKAGPLLLLYVLGLRTLMAEPPVSAGRPG